MNKNTGQDIPNIQIYFDFDTNEEVFSAESWYINACEVLYVQKQIEEQIKSLIIEQRPVPIFISQDFVNINFNGLDALGSLSKIYMYLSGIVFENLTKTIIIQKSPEKLGQITGGGKAHDLNRLMELAGIDLSEEDKNFFERISVYIVWAGRYSCPKVNKKQGHTSGRIEFSTEDIQTINFWINKVNCLANEAVSAEKA